MRLLFTAILLLQSALTFSQQKRILFIGNSYTAQNTLPILFKNLAQSGGDTVYVDSNNPGGYTFQMHTTNTTTLSKIAQGNWDYVVLQEQSQLPSFPPAQVQTQCYPYARQLDSLITHADSCAETVFYMTWGRKYGDASNCASYPQICTFLGMQERLRQSYVEMGDLNHATVAPAGQAFKRSRELDSTIDLYTADYSHPSLAGSYLTACVFYATIFQKTPVGLSFHSSLNSTTAGFLQQVADEVVFDSLDTWNVAIDHPLADYTFNYTGPTEVTFTDNSTNADQIEWYIDGTYYTGASVTHQFPSAATYNVIQIASNNCFTDTLASTINLVPATIDSPSIETIRIFPNPTKDLLTIAGFNNVLYKIYDVNGRLIANGKSSGSIQTSEMNAGIYILEVESAKEVFRIRFVKE